MNQIASSENASTDAATIEDRAGSASFVLTSHEFEHSGANLKLLRPALREGDEVIVLTASEPVRPPEASWFRVVSIPGASDFTLRSHIPAVCRNEWVVLLEDHALVNKRTLDAILEVIRNKPNADLVVFLGKNLTSVSRWGWAIFLHVFALVWAPLQGPPPSLRSRRLSFAGQNCAATRVSPRVRGSCRSFRGYSTAERSNTRMTSSSIT